MVAAIYLLTSKWHEVDGTILGMILMLDIFILIALLVGLTIVVGAHTS